MVESSRSVDVSDKLSPDVVEGTMAREKLLGTESMARRRTIGCMHDGSGLPQRNANDVDRRTSRSIVRIACRIAILRVSHAV
jgi:hypothetical protein